MWLSNSSVGRKVVMSVTGIALILFLTFHIVLGSELVCSGRYTRSGRLVHHSHHLCLLADYAEPPCTR